MTKSFVDAKLALAQATMLSHPVPDAPIAITTDASDCAVGAVHEQLVDVSEPWSARQQRHLAFISEFTTDIKHIDGKSNVVADCLSRATVQAVHWAPLTSTTTADVARAFIDTWVARFSTPSDISLDHSPQFTSELWTEVARILGVQLHHTTAFHLQPNGLCERFHRSLKTALRASLTDDRWIERLPWVLLGLRTAPKEDLQTSSAELVYGQTLRVPRDFIPDCTKPWSLPSEHSALLDRINAFKPVPTSQHGLTVAWMPKDLSAAEFIFIHHDAHRNSLQPPYDGAFRVLEAGAKTFLVDVGGRTERVTVDRLKPAHGELGQPMVPALAPRRGRPTTNNSGDPKEKSQAVQEVLPATGSYHCTRSGRHVRVPIKLMLPLLVNSGGASVGADTNNPQITDA
ncbi:uncharacterized protein LOC113642761 [Tachysurus fulvidraco]|uniref:uncharacterized protein LOC113642761 n=1 Tax=Tachysurus fulvidraco TaxID=1234273 RepID=UPI001FEE4605|nr:uncharacterized protein LOC113642761 [Tachysurus fulvidraco]